MMLSTSSLKKQIPSSFTFSGLGEHVYNSLKDNGLKIPKGLAYLYFGGGNEVSKAMYHGVACVNANFEEIAQQIVDYFTGLDKGSKVRSSHVKHYFSQGDTF